MQAEADKDLLTATLLAICEQKTIVLRDCGAPPSGECIIWSELLNE